MPSHTYRTAPVPSERMPTGIPYIVGNEAAERFSFYGMRAILTIFMVKYLAGADGQPDPMTAEDAKTWTHLFVAGVYLFPIFGAPLADLLWGKYKTILSLSIVYCLGHLALAINDQRPGLAVGLTLIAIGSGGIKPCVSAHVGDQFGKHNQHLISKVFSWFYFSINLGAFISTLLTPMLLDSFGPQVAFGVPGLLMLIATWVFWLGRHEFVHIPPAGRKLIDETLSEDGRTALKNLSILYIFVAMFWCLFDQTMSAWVLQAEQMDRTVFGYRVLSSQLQAINPILVLSFIPLFTYVVYPAISKVFPLTPLRKVAIGFFVTGFAFITTGFVETRIDGGRMVQFVSPGKAESDFSKLELESTASADPERLSPNNLLDGNVGTGWLSTRLNPDKPDTMFPRHLVVRLRDRHAWDISGVRVNPGADPDAILNVLQAAHDAARDEHVEEAAPDDLGPPPTEQNALDCYAREVDLLVSNTRKGPWQHVGSLTLQRSNEFQELSLESPVSAGYVMVQVNSNHGGDYVALGEIEVNTAQSLPPSASENAASVWPNVAAIGHRPTIWWHLLAYAIITAAEIMVSITCLEFSYTQAPKTMKSVVMSVYLLSVTAGNLLVSAVNMFIPNDDGTSKLPGADYYWFFAGCMFVTAVLFVFVAKHYRGKTFIQDEESLDPEDAIAEKDI